MRTFARNHLLRAIGSVLNALSLLYLTSCSINPRGFNEFWQYQIARMTYKESKRQVEQELEERFLDPEDYHEKKRQIALKYKSREFLKIGPIGIDSKGRIRYNRDESKDSYSYGGTIDSLGLSTSLDRIKIRVRISKFRIDYKQHYDGEWLLLFSIKIGG